MIITAIWSIRLLINYFEHSMQPPRENPPIDVLKDPLVHLPDPNAIVVLNDDNDSFTIKDPEPDSPSTSENESYKDYLENKCDAIIASKDSSDDQDLNTDGITDMQNNEKIRMALGWIERSIAIVKMNRIDDQKKQFANRIAARKTQGAYLSAAHAYNLKILAEQIAALALPMYPAEDKSYANNFVFALYVGLLFPEEKLLPQDLEVPIVKQLEDLMDKAIKNIRLDALKAIDPIIFGQLDEKLWAYHCDASRDFLQAVQRETAYNPNCTSANSISKLTTSLTGWYQENIKQRYDAVLKEAIKQGSTDPHGQSLEHIRLLSDHGLNLQCDEVATNLDNGNPVQSVMDQFYASAKALYCGFSNVVNNLDQVDISKKRACLDESALKQHVLVKSQEDFNKIEDKTDKKNVKRHVEKLEIMQHLISHPKSREQCLKDLGTLSPGPPPEQDQNEWLEKSYDYYNKLSDTIMNNLNLKTSILTRITDSMKKMLNFPTNDPSPQEQASKKKLNPQSEEVSARKIHSWWRRLMSKNNESRSDPSHDNQAKPDSRQSGGSS